MSYCARLQTNVSDNVCKLCTTRKATRLFFARQAASKHIDYQSAQCPHNSPWCAEDSIAQLPARDSIHKLPTRARRQAHLCTHANVISWRECCGGKQRPLRITCDVFGAQSWASCLTCRDYTASETPAKRNPTKS